MVKLHYSVLGMQWKVFGNFDVIPVHFLGINSPFWSKNGGQEVDFQVLHARTALKSTYTKQIVFIWVFVYIMVWFRVQFKKNSTSDYLKC